MTVSEETWNKATEIGIDKLKQFAKEEGVKREISKHGITEREAQELVRQFRGKETHARRGGGAGARSERGGGQIQTISKTENENGSSGKGNDVVIL